MYIFTYLTLSKLVKFGSGSLHFQNYLIQVRFKIVKFTVSVRAGNHTLGVGFYVFPVNSYSLKS